jgi:hypothetical protein
MIFARWRFHKSSGCKSLAISSNQNSHITLMRMATNLAHKKKSQCEWKNKACDEKKKINKTLSMRFLLLKKNCFKGKKINFYADDDDDDGNEWEVREGNI